MRLTLSILGALLIVQALLGALSPNFQEAFSFQKLGAALDAELVKLTVGLCALSIAGLLKRRTQQDMAWASEIGEPLSAED